MSAVEFEILARRDERGACLEIKAKLSSREDANAFVEAFDPIQLAMFPGAEEAGEAEPEADEVEADANDVNDEPASTRPADPLPGTKASDVLAALRAGTFDHRDRAKRLDMSAYEARTIYERLVAAGHWSGGLP